MASQNPALPSSLEQESLSFKPQAQDSLSLEQPFPEPGSEWEAKAKIAAEPGAKLSVAELQGTLLKSQVFAPKRGNTLSRRLLLTLMPTTLVPLLVAGVLGFQAEKQRAQGEALNILQEKSLLAANAAEDFIQRSFQVSSLIGINPDVERVVVEGTAVAIAKGLASKEISELENTFAQNKLLSPDPEITEFLVNVAQVEDTGDIVITENNGFNVAYSSAPPDFAQQDERWWRTATSTASGKHIGSPEIDRATNRTGVSFSQAVKNDKGELRAVIKILMPTTSMDNRIQSSIASSAVGASQAIQIVDARTGIPFNLIEPTGASSEKGKVIGGSQIAGLALALQGELRKASQSPTVLQSTIQQTTNVAALAINRLESTQGEEILTALADIGSKNTV
ncbi:MAG: hypothetical protein HC771_12580 [Synechococcales cyanobacterium CRU_2_2]|nr:hypothetical protein [Synechococcales cyanobacterium CRU_2_2]